MNDETEVPREGRVPIIRNRSTISLEHHVTRDNIESECYAIWISKFSILTYVSFEKKEL